MAPELTDRHLDMIVETHDEVIKIKAVLGNGERGLAHQVRCNTRNLNKVYIILAFIAGGGGIGLGIIKLIGG